MTDRIADHVVKLERELKIVRYERKHLQDRLDAIRATKEKLMWLLDTPTPQEKIEAET